MGITAGMAFLTVVSMSEANRREKRTTRAQKEAQAVEAANRANDARKARRKQIREARIRQAEVENVSAASGQTGSSAAVAAGDSLQAQLGTNVGDIQNALAQGSALSNANQKILDAQRKSGIEILADGGRSVLGFAAAKSS